MYLANMVALRGLARVVIPDARRPGRLFASGKPLARHQPRPARDAPHALERGGVVPRHDRVQEGGRVAGRFPKPAMFFVDGLGFVELPIYVGVGTVRALALPGTAPQCLGPRAQQRRGGGVRAWRRTKLSRHPRTDGSSFGADDFFAARDDCSRSGAIPRLESRG